MTVERLIEILNTVPDKKSKVIINNFRANVTLTIHDLDEDFTHVASLKEGGPAYTFLSVKV